MAISSKEREEQEGRILLVIEALKNDQIPSLREAARVFNIPQTTLWNRVKGVKSRSDIRANSCKLTLPEEETLEQWILSLDTRGLPPRPSHVREMASILIRKRGASLEASDEALVGQKWVYNFIKRHDSLKTRFSRRYDYKRALCEDPRLIKEWFDRVQNAISENGIADEDIYNFDETGFAMGLVATAKVVTRSDCVGKPFLIQPGNREWVTSIECINASGWVLPPYIIVKGKMYIEAWYEGNVPHSWRINTSPNSWTSNEIGLHWLEHHFIPLIKERRVGKYSLLILDGHDSHLTPRFDEICSQNGVVPICMPPHSSHLCQPLDVACFAPLKKAYGGMIEQLIRQGIHYIDKVDFLDTFPKARELAFKKSSIQNAFSASGLVPFQPDEVLGKLMYSLREITPTGSQTTTSSILKTPKNTRQLKKHETTIERLLRERTKSPPESMRTALSYIIKGCEIALNRTALLEQENRDLRAADERQTKRRKRSNRQLAGLEGATVHEAIQLFRRAREEDEALGIQRSDSAAGEEQPRRRAPPRCSSCNKVGHIRTWCPARVKHQEEAI